MYQLLPYSLQHVPCSLLEIDNMSGLCRGGLTGHYMGKVIEVDLNYGGVRPGEVGRVQRKLETFGEVRRLVFGAFGEVSEGVHVLIQVFAQSGLRAVGLQRGRLCDKGELGILVERIREQLSKTPVRTQDGQYGRGGRGSWEEECGMS